MAFGYNHFYAAALEKLSAVSDKYTQDEVERLAEKLWMRYLRENMSETQEQKRKEIEGMKK